MLYFKCNSEFFWIKLGIQIFGLLIHESIDVSVIDHVVVFATFVEDGLSISNFLGLLEIANDKKNAEFFFRSC